jgi:hypothetical protein
MDRLNDSSEIDPTYRLLALCARAEGHSLFYEQLKEQLLRFKAWEDLPAQAEIHGMAPLLWYHIHHSGVSIPQKTEQTFKGLYIRQRVFIQAHTQVLLEINSLFKGAGIRAVVLKGLALAHEYYPDPALRPVSDIDLLFKKNDILPALDLLKEAGFHVHTPQASLTSDLLPKELKADSPSRNGLVTHIELHHYDPRVISMIDNSLDDEFRGFNLPLHSLKIGENTIHVPDPMDTLHYLIRHFTRHMFVTTTSSQLPLKWIADIVSLVERHAETINWNAEPNLLNRLEVIYSLTPLPERLLNIIPIRQIPPPKGVNLYPQGWPQQVMLEWKNAGFWNYIKRAFASPAYIWHTLSTPSDWWLRLYYGIDEKSVFWYGQVVYRLKILKMAVAKLMRKE